MQDELLKLLDESLEFAYHSGDVTPITQPHTTGWRTLPWAVTAQVAGGEGTVELGDGLPIRGRDGGAFCVAPGVYHRATLATPAAVSRWSCVTYTVFGAIDLFTFLELTFQSYDGSDAGRIGEINTHLAALAKVPAASLQKTVERKALGFALLAVITRHAAWRLEHDRLVVDSKRLIPVFDHVRNNLQKTIRIDDLARRVHLSPPRFYALFRRGAGVSPQKYIQKLRVQKAQQYLISTDLSVAEIGARVGHQDPFFFSRIFKKECGMSPTLYRTRLRGGMV